jgi:hypothetical protein
MNREDIKAKVRKFVGDPELHVYDTGRFVDGIVDMVLDEAKTSLTLDDATVGRCADAAESIHERWGSWEDVARAVLAAAVKEEQA